jgi:hypothetical protein
VWSADCRDAIGPYSPTTSRGSAVSPECGRRRSIALSQPQDDVLFHLTEADDPADKLRGRDWPDGDGRPFCGAILTALFQTSGMVSSGLLKTFLTPALNTVNR